jgi:hypothetical protein
MWTQKNKNKINHHQMKNVLVKCIENFLTYIYLILKALNDMIIVNFYIRKSLSH